MTDKKYKYWLAVVDGQLLQFSELAHMMATALHPEGEMDYVAARINLDDELKLAVRDGLLKVRNPSGLGFHTFPHGDALQRAVLMPNTDLEPFLNARGIELRITPYGNGPDYWTLDNAAAAIQEQEGWHDGTRAEFQDQMQDAAQSGALAILDPRTCLPIRPLQIRTYWEYVTPERVNTWLASLKAPYRWKPLRPVVNHAVDSVQSELDAYSNAWYDATLDAEHWWELSSVAPREAAMLLCRLNPHDDNSSPLATTTDLTTPDDFKKLLRVFEDLALTTPLTRNLAAWLEVAKSRKLKFHKWIEPYASMMTLKVGDVKSAQLDQTKLSTSDDGIDFNMIATRQQLIDAFGVFTGMDDSWFTNLKDTPRLKDARKVAGSGGKDSTEPLFCPYEVMMWLADPKQKKGRKLGANKGWQLLERHFQKVYNQYSIGDTRND